MPDICAMKSAVSGRMKSAPNCCAVRGSFTRVVISEIYIACSEGRCVVTALKQERQRLPRVHVLVYTRHNAPG